MIIYHLEKHTDYQYPNTDSIGYFANLDMAMDIANRHIISTYNMTPVWNENNTSDFYGCEMFTIKTIKVINDEPEEFNYVIAHPWADKKPDILNTYSFQGDCLGDVQRGTMDAAKRALDYVQGKKFLLDKTYYIYKVTYEKVS